MRFQRGSVVLIAVGVSALLVASSLGVQAEEPVPMLLVDQGRARAAIVLPEDAPQALRETAQDLSEIIGKMSGAPLPFVSMPGSLPALALGVQEQDRSLAPLEYHVWREGDTLYFSGGSAQGVINGVYAFLDYLGCRWYTPDDLGEYIPKRETITVGPLNLQDAPDFESIGGFGGHPTNGAGTLWVRRNRIEGFPGQYHSHNWNDILPPALFTEHPEYFALLGDERRTNQFCTTHPAVLDTAVARIRRFFDQRPDMPMYSLSPNDNIAFCRCSTCRALDDSLGIDPFAPGNAITDRLVYFFNQVARELEKTHPDKHLAFYAYLSHTDPPKIVKPHPMLLPVLCHTPWDYCQHHAIDDPECERNRRFADIVLSWEKLSPKLYLYDYWGHFYLCGPLGLVHTIRRDLPWLHNHGVVGIWGEMHAQWWTQTMNFYLPVALAWNLNTDVDALVGEFYENLFGPAAAEVSAYGRMFEDVLAQAPKDAEHDGEQVYMNDMTPAFFERAAALLDSAENIIRASDLSLAEKHAIIERLRRYRYGLGLTRQQTLMEQKRQIGHLAEVADHADSLIAILDEVEADTSLIGMIELPAAKQQARGELERVLRYRRLWNDTASDPQRRAELHRLLDGGRTREVARSFGYLCEWNVVGLWSNPGGGPLDTHLPPEDGVNLHDTYEGRSGEIRWQPCGADHPYGIVDLSKHFYPEGTEYTTSYLYTEVELQEDTEVHLEATRDDQLALWVNDLMVYPPTSEGNSNDDIRITARFKRGGNRILAKVINEQHGFKFSLRLVSSEGKPLKGTVGE